MVSNIEPVELVERAVRNSSKGRDVVLDPFGGSGSTLIACEKAGRRGYLMELEFRLFSGVRPNKAVLY